MYLRLAFAVAAQLQSEIMVIDEVLAVGDAEFQRKCLGKIAEVERSGRTILFVSHNLDAVQRLCQRTLWLERGQLVAEGPTSEVLQAYLTSGLERSPRSTWEDADPRAPVWLRSVSLLDENGQPASGQLPRDAPFSIEMEFEIRQRVPGLDLSVVVQTNRGLRVLDEAWSDRPSGERGEPGLYVARMTVPPVLTVGDYTVGVWIGSAYESLLWRDDAVIFGLSGHDGNRPERVVQLGLGFDVVTRPLRR
jgi:ABC-2 type transport system ATP-binding protein/lipopolysaccharide transport system ATP-binding protein